MSMDHSDRLMSVSVNEYREWIGRGKVVMAGQLADAWLWVSNGKAIVLNFVENGYIQSWTATFLIEYNFIGFAHRISC